VGPHGHRTEETDGTGQDLPLADSEEGTVHIYMYRTPRVGGWLQPLARDAPERNILAMPNYLQTGGWPSLRLRARRTDIARGSARRLMFLGAQAWHGGRCIDWMDT
jgi:hypothetical protein